MGNHYEVKSTIVTKYYFAGATRLAVRTGDTLSFLLADHIGSSSVTTDANGGYSAEALYKAFGETRYTLGNLNTDYHFTGQREEVSLGIYWFQSTPPKILRPAVRREPAALPRIQNPGISKDRISESFRAGATEANISIIIVRSEPVPIRRAEVAIVVVPRPAPQYAEITC